MGRDTTDAPHLYRRRLPHWRPASSTPSTYFVAWRVRRGCADLEPSERSIVLSAFNHFNGVRYKLIAVVVMNDHVHALFKLLDAHTLKGVLHTWKSFTAHEIQRKGSRTGGIWQDESFDRVVRDEGDLLEKAKYIVENPQKRWPELSNYEWVQCWETTLTPK